MSVLGLDISLTSTGCVVLSNGGEVLYNGTLGYGLIKPKVWDYQKRLNAIVNGVEEILSDYGPGLQVVLEDYAYGKKKNTSSLTGLAEATGAIKCLLYQWEIEPIILTASQARKITFGFNPSVSKVERKLGSDIKIKLAKELLDRFGSTFPTDDEVDAFILAEAVRKLADGKPLPPDVIESLRKAGGRRKGKKKKEEKVGK